VYVPGIGGAILVAAFVWHAARTPHALIDLKLFRDRGFSISLISMVLFVIAFFGAMLLFPLYFQQVRFEGALNAGLLLAPQGIGAMIMMPIAGRLVDRGFTRWLVQIGLVVIVGSMVLFTQLDAKTGYLPMEIALFVMGLGMGMTMMPIMSIALKSLSQEQVARGSTTLNIIQQVAASIGTAMLSVILFNEIKDRLAPVIAQLPPAPPGAEAPTTTSIRDLPEPVRELLVPPMADGYATTFVWALVLLAVAFIPTLFLPSGKSTAESVAESDPTVDPATNEPPVVDEEREPVADR
jgi:MFS family permease